MASSETSKDKRLRRHHSTTPYQQYEPPNPDDVELVPEAECKPQFQSKWRPVLEKLRDAPPGFALKFSIAKYAGGSLEASSLNGLRQAAQRFGLPIRCRVEDGIVYMVKRRKAE